MAKVAYLFLDTNVFVQCRPLEQLDWSSWREFDEVHLIVSRPVQSEIDNQKNKGGERLAQRARKASSLLRRIIIDKVEHLLINPADPVVKLFINVALRPSPDLTDRLDYSRPDDQLVGTVHSFVQQNPGVDACVLTHDTGPMASARMVGVGIAPVPDDWLLPPERSEADKRIHSLEAEVARLKENEPKFSIACIDEDGNKLARLEFQVVSFEPLSPAEVAVLLEKLRQRFPLATDFGPRERMERPAQGMMHFLGKEEVFTPATEKEIEEYCHKHEQWLQQCEDTLRDLPQALQARDRPPTFVFAASNEGTRPANDVLVTLLAKGQFGITPPPYRSRDGDDEGVDNGSEEAAALPNPPAVPRGRWASALLSELGAFGAFPKFPPGFGSAIAQVIGKESSLRATLTPEPDDPNKFYYKPDRPSVPGEEFSVECRQWRHDREPKQFVVQIHLDQDEGVLSGAIECRIHAANLSQSATKLVPVQIQVRRVKAFGIAVEMVERVSR
jgi:PIN domain